MFKPTPTRQVLELAKALDERGVRLEIEHWDGHKHVDIFIPSGHLYIEVDGLNHYTDPKQIIADLKRDHFSDGDDFRTMRVTNQLIETKLAEVADAIANVARKNTL